MQPRSARHDHQRDGVPHELLCTLLTSPIPWRAGDRCDGAVPRMDSESRDYPSEARHPISPEPGARRSFEGADDIRCYPATIEVSGLRRYPLLIDKAAVKWPGVESDEVTQRHEG